jgi:hypothetical protein
MSFRVGGIGAKGRGTYTTVDPFTILADLEEVFVVTLLSTAKCATNLLGGLVDFSFRSVGGVARANQWKVSALVMNMHENFVRRHC